MIVKRIHSRNRQFGFYAEQRKPDKENYSAFDKESAHRLKVSQSAAALPQL